METADKNDPLCGETTICRHLGERLVDSGKGFKAMHTVRRGVAGVRFLGVAYKTSNKDRGLMLNQCPWCYGKPGYFKRDEENSHASL